MPFYRDADGNAHFLDSAAFESVLPAGCVKIGGEEAEGIRAMQAGYSETNQARADASSYLASTDWYVMRMMETGVAIPPDVSERRSAARDLLSEGKDQ